MQKRLFASIGVERLVVVDQESGQKRFAYKVIQEEEPKLEAPLQQPVKKTLPEKGTNENEQKQEDSQQKQPVAKPRQDYSSEPP